MDVSRDGQVVVPRFFAGELRLRTEGACGFLDITEHVAEFVEGHRLENGMVLLISLHTTAGLLINEHETGFRHDFREVADRIVPSEGPYRHDDLSVRFENLCPEDREFPNGHAHLQHALFGAPSVAVPVEDFQLVLGQWQRVFLLEFDRPRERRVRMQGFGVVGPAAEDPSTTTAELAVNGRPAHAGA